LSAVEQEGECVLAFGLAGCPTQTPSGAVRLKDGHALVIAVLELFLDLARPDQTRMRHLLAEYPVAGFVAQVAERVPLLSIVSGSRVTNSNVLHIGTHPQRETGRVYVCATPPLGRLDPAMLRGAAQLARERGDGSLRFTPWQSLLLPDIHERDAAEVIHSLENLRLRCSADDALAHLIACTGSTGCGKGLADTKGDARQLAALLQRHGQTLNVHLSGCPRSCAAAHIAPVTLLAVSPGHYDLYFRDAAQPGFGTLHARNLTIEAVAALLDARSRSSLDA
jgi:precorrin-3B synthase